jgi:hypothetical protein
MDNRLSAQIALNAELEHKSIASELREQKFKPQRIPNRTTLRNKKFNLTRSTGTGHARLGGKKLVPFRWDQFVAIHVKDATGRTVRKMVIPRENVEEAALKPLPTDHPRSQQ